MTSWVSYLPILVAFGAAYATSSVADRILKRQMGHFARGIFTFYVGIFFLLVLTLAALIPCFIAKVACPDS